MPVLLILTLGNVLSEEPGRNPGLVKPRVYDGAEVTVHTAGTEIEFYSSRQKWHAMIYHKITKYETVRLENTKVCWCFYGPLRCKLSWVYFSMLGFRTMKRTFRIAIEFSVCKLFKIILLKVCCCCYCMSTLCHLVKCCEYCLRRED